MKNYYNILGVPDNASAKTITEAYKKLAQKFHPDRNPGDDFFSERFKDVNEAYQVLGKEDERLEYDEKLLNYADAYDLLKQQQHVDNETRIKQRRSSRGETKSSKSLWGVGGVVIICAAVLLWINSGDSKASSEEKFSGIVETVEDENMVDSATAVQFKATGETAAVEQQSAPDIELKQKHVDAEKAKKIIVTNDRNSDELPGRSLAPKEIEKILNELRNHNGLKGVQVIQSKNSDIQKDFAIASILQKNGFAISGRKFTNQDYEGIQISETDECLNLIIGNTTNH